MKKSKKKNWQKPPKKKVVEKNKKEMTVEQSRVVGTFEKNRSFGFVVPDSRKIPMDIYISKRNFNGAKNHQKVIVEIIKQPQKGKKLEGKVVQIIGDSNEAGMDMLSIIREYDLPYEFPKTVKQELEYIDEKIDKKDIPNREDLREEEIFTIDGEDAKDLDDAVAVQKHADGTYTLSVHIADVSYYVKEGSSLNKEALKRGTSIYMLDRVIPMLPRKLSNGICSLNAGEDRFTLSVTMEIDKKGKVTSSRIYKAIINVTERMSYTDVYKLLEKSDKTVIARYEKYIPHFEAMAELAELLEKRRMAKGYLDLDIPESKITLDKNGKAIEVGKYEITKANHIIEQFMLTANETVAETFEKLKAPFIYRVHEMPDMEKVQDLNNFLFDFDYKVETSKGEVKPKAFQRVLGEIKGKPEEKVISTLVLRTLKQARYESENKGHFGIASNYYCHFTSPIRRYPDLFIHRVISSYLKNHYEISDKIEGKWRKQAQEYAQQSSERERIAVTAERDAQDLKKAEFMESKIGEIYEGIISGVTSFGIFVELENTVEGFVRFENLGNDYYIYDEEKRRLIGEQTKEIFKIGDKMKVKVIEANKLQKRISFAKEE